MFRISSFLSRKSRNKSSKWNEKTSFSPSWNAITRQNFLRQSANIIDGNETHKHSTTSSEQFAESSEQQPSTESFISNEKNVNSTAKRLNLWQTGQIPKVNAENLNQHDTIFTRKRFQSKARWESNNSHNDDSKNNGYNTDTFTNSSNSNSNNTNNNNSKNSDFTSNKMKWQKMSDEYNEPNMVQKLYRGVQGKSLTDQLKFLYSECFTVDTKFGDKSNNWQHSENQSDGRANIDTIHDHKQAQSGQVFRSGGNLNAIDILRGITSLYAPSGTVLEVKVLRGRIVGVLFFNSQERSINFMQILRKFLRNHSPNFVVVAISLDNLEMRQITSSCGFMHCTHRQGAQMVAHDCGIVNRQIWYVPRLYIVEGHYGSIITRSGVTALRSRFDTCFDAWQKGEEGVELVDYLINLVS